MNVIKYQKLLGCSQAVRHQTLTLAFRWFEPIHPSQQKRNFCLPKVPFLFIQAAGLVYHRRTTCGVYQQGRRAALAYHHAPACIYLRLDEIQHFVLMIYRNKLRMICNSDGIDDIQGFALIDWQKYDIMFLTRGDPLENPRC